VYRFVRHIIDSIFPPREEALVVRKITDTDLRTLYSPHTVAQVCVLSSFTNPQVKALIHEAKFHQNSEAYERLAKLLWKYLDTEEKKDCATYTIIPVPLSPERHKARGYNQVHEVVRACQNFLPNIQIDADTLIRVRDTKPQTSLGREERLSNMQGAFSVINPAVIRDRDIILIDDVLTTGATLQAASEAVITCHPRSLTCISLAH
jgi:competence protein ComFC